MARVPTYEPGQVQANVGQTQQVNVRTNEQAFGGGQDPRAAQAAVGGVVDAFAQYRMQADEVAVTEADGKASSLTNELIFNPKDGFMAKKGKDAFGIQETYSPEFEKKMDEIEGTLSNDRQKALFGARRAQYAVKFEADMQKHMSAQGTAYDKEVTDSRIDVAKNDALLNFSDQDAVRASVSTQKGVIENFARRNGMSPEWTQNEITKHVSETHISIVDRMVDLDQPNQAREYYNTYKGEISGKDQARIEKNLSAGTVKLESQIASEKIVSQGMSMSAALAEARKIEDPDLKDATVTRVKERYEENASAQRTQYELNSQAATRNLAQNGGNLDTAISPTALAELPLETRKGLEQRAYLIKTGRPIETDPVFRYDLEQIASADKKKFLEMDLNGQAGAKLSPSDLEYFSKMQAGMRNSTAEGEKLQNGMLTKQQIFTQSLAQFGLNPNNKKRKSEYAELSLRINASIVNWQETNGKTADERTIRDITESYLVNVRKDVDVFGSLISGEDVKFGDFIDSFRGPRPLSETDPGSDDYTVPVENIPAPTKRRIEAALRQAGRIANDANISAAFKEHAKLLRGQN